MRIGKKKTRALLAYMYERALVDVSNIRSLLACHSKRSPTSGPPK